MKEIDYNQHLNVIKKIYSNNIIRFQKKEIEREKDIKGNNFPNFRN